MADSVLHAQLRIYKANSYYKGLLKTAITSKCGWRRRIARKELKKLKMAARETGEIKKAKEKLENRVQQLTLGLQAQKRLREAKDLEIAELKDALCGMRIQVDEANSRVVKEREVAAAHIAVEKGPPAIEDNPVFIQYTEKVDSLTAVVESLKAMLLSERQATEESRKACNDAVRKVDQLQDSVQRLEEKVSNKESKNQALHQQQVNAFLCDEQQQIQENQGLLIQ